MRRSRLAAWMLLVGPLAGCMKKDIERLENQVQLLDKRVELLQQDQEKANTEILESWKRLRAQLEQELGSVQRSSADSSTRIEDLVRQMRTLSDRIEKTGFQFQRLSEQLAMLQDRLGRQPGAAGEMGGGGVAGDASAGGAPSLIPPGTPPASGADAVPTAADGGFGSDELDAAGATAPPATSYDPGVDPDLTYKAAYSDYAQGNFKLAIVNFETYVRQFPTSAKAVLAQYFIGESYYALGQYRDAVAAFDRVISSWPGDEKVPVAYLKKGYALLAMGQRALGSNVLQELISKYPNTHEALLAKERLSAL